jgi:hypothetical protein
MTRRTSADAYRTIEENGLLGHMMFQVYKILFTYGPMTAGEVFQMGLDLKVWNKAVKGGICARLTDLRDRQVACEVGERECQLSGMRTILWDVTEKLPVKPDRRLTKLEKYRKLNRKLLTFLRVADQKVYDFKTVAEMLSKRIVEIEGASDGTKYG